MAHVLESAGLATVGISLVREQAEGVRAPRMLHCDFPLGRPLGRPQDPPFQRRVIWAALELLERRTGPVLEDFPDRIEGVADEGLACPLPPRADMSVPEAVEEALGLRRAYERRQESAAIGLVGRVLGADQIAGALAAFIELCEGTRWDQAPFPVAVTAPETLTAMALDVRGYYEEAALALADHVPAARSAERWFYRITSAGRVLKCVQAVLREAGLPQHVWNPIVPITEQDQPVSMQ